MNSRVLEFAVFFFRPMAGRWCEFQVEVWGLSMLAIGRGGR